MTQITYTDNLDQLLEEDDSKPTKMYRPSEKLLEIPNYFRKYSTNSGSVIVELSKKIYTREMRTAMVKKWLQIQKIHTHEVLFELIPEKGMNTQLMSVLFHLIEMGFEDAIPFYDVINKVIINSRKLYAWLSSEFKNSGDTHLRREYLKFKYLYDRLINNGNSEKILKENKQQIMEEFKLSESEFTEFMEIMQKTRLIVNYEQKKAIVKQHKRLFKKLTGNVNHFKYFLDLDYFFIVFEMLIDKSNQVVIEANKYLIEIFKERPHPPPPRRQRRLQSPEVPPRRRQSRTHSSTQSPEAVYVPTNKQPEGPELYALVNEPEVAPEPTPPPAPAPVVAEAEVAPAPATAEVAPPPEPEVAAEEHYSTFGPLVRGQGEFSVYEHPTPLTGGSRVRSKKKSFNESSKKSKRINYN